MADTGLRQRSGPARPTELGAEREQSVKASAQTSGWSHQVTRLKRRLTLVRLTENDHFNLVLTWAIFVVAVSFAAENWSNTAYGRFGGNAYIAVNPRLGWFLLEFPVTCTFVYFFFVKGGSQSKEAVPRFMACIMLLHYAYRNFAFPYLIRVHGESKNFSLVPALGGVLVTVTHGYLNAKWFAEYGRHLNQRWLRDPRFWIGLLVYLSGLAMIIWHDKIVRDLRADPNAPRYQIPHGGFFEYVTCAQYFVELWAFAGFAILSWGPNGAFVLAVSMANLVPRAPAITAWYEEKFGDAYPDRNHIFPGIY
ncbi:3-oxo-5-alpha-steroid 4-dehydrogenase 1 [Hondaea fermentalgiana]|uniref:3-oxo-5-alpha-steroid 4-dehydrogenase 1 n=1 Tax=Hondaea fermentalgiana TaxID=2315210 RepID=A0A2R5GP84_9STRA|nr:3-oxo-5-alpha-steroid 4-dehydrogenase 1 [Hondaea fermentalgiana]|eukprot:GBG30433.1 3-oxo-5-alpha-steroid 4-dehydrogenase 1 [Hondaea fermentalgiana]